jgi:hypothetical protein
MLRLAGRDETLGLEALAVRADTAIVSPRASFFALAERDDVGGRPHESSDLKLLCELRDEWPLLGLGGLLERCRQRFLDDVYAVD